MAAFSFKHGKGALWCAFAFLCCLHCGDPATEDPAGDSPTLIISAGDIFTTTTLTVAATDAITIINNDSSAHTITSESAADAFDDSGDFDVVVAGDSSAILTLPADAASGDIFLFYCRLHTGAMSPATGTITIE